MNPYVGMLHTLSSERNSGQMESQWGIRWVWKKHREGVVGKILLVWNDLDTCTFKCKFTFNMISMVKIPVNT